MARPISMTRFSVLAALTCVGALACGPAFSPTLLDAPDDGAPITPDAGGDAQGILSASPDVKSAPDAAQGGTQGSDHPEDPGALAAPEASSTGDAGAPDALAEASPRLCCIEGMALQPNNVHCGIGATAPCGDGAYNSASCPELKEGTVCASWPDSYGDPQTCQSSGLCCPGTVKVCP